MNHSSIDISIECNNVLTCTGDVLVLKYAQSLYGVDEVVVERLEESGLLSLASLPEVSDFLFLPSQGKVAANNVLFIGTVPLRYFGYEEIRNFACSSLSNLAKAAPNTDSILITLHGAGYGLDEIEAFESEVAGFVDAVSAGEFPSALRSIKIVERSLKRAQRLQNYLDEVLPDNKISFARSNSSTIVDGSSQDRLSTVGFASTKKSSVFVAMPFAEEIDDVFYYGIQGPIKEAGFLCERADKLSFTGDIMERVKERIEEAEYVVADLTRSNPNVYLEVGYAWGLRRPTILLLSESDDLKFDVRGQRCLVYKSIRDLETMLTREIKNIFTDY